MGEIYTYPTVKQVIFQVRFPNLFYLESKIGDLQLRVMEEFPETELSHRRSIVFADLGPGTNPMDMAEKAGGEPWAKVWVFKSPNNYQMNILGNSLDITSQHHTTYDADAPDRFRDIIELAVSNFLEFVNVPMFTRIGLRYTDECPMPGQKTTEAFREFYDSSFPLDRFELENAKQMATIAVVEKKEYSLCYREQLIRVDDKWKLILDFDGFAENIPSDSYLAVTDKLHKIVSDEFQKTIREPVREYMREGKE